MSQVTTSSLVAPDVFACPRIGSISSRLPWMVGVLRGKRRAAKLNAHDTAADLLTGALESIERIPATGDGAQPAPDDRDAERVGLLGRLLRAQIRAGAVAAARATRRRAIDVAEAADRDDLLVDAFTGWTEPTPWQTRP